MTNKPSYVQPLFTTNYTFTNRETKAKYVWLKYQSILENSKILDVGADEGYLKNLLPKTASYWGIGLGGSPDQQIDLEKEKIPFADNSYDCVLCLDVLEHVDNIHEIFDELCRVTRHYVIISLPNPWADFYHMLRFGEYKPGQATKFYGLPLERPEDRHKWFFSADEAISFIEYRSKKNDLKIIQADYERRRGEPGNYFVKNLRKICRNFLFTRNLNMENLYKSTLWVVLEK